jgi:hypothetical protein
MRETAGAAGSRSAQISVKKHSHQTGTKTTGLGSVILHRPSIKVQSRETNIKLPGQDLDRPSLKGQCHRPR